MDCVRKSIQKIFGNFKDITTEITEQQLENNLGSTAKKRCQRRKRILTVIELTFESESDNQFASFLRVSKPEISPNKC